jgi:hypothetical protein
LSWTLIAPSLFSWNALYISGAFASGTRWVANVSQPSGSSSPSSGMRSSIQRLMLHWPMRSWICLSNKVSIGIGSAMPP